MNLFQGLGPGYFNGVQIVESLAMVDHVEDWSGVRSPSRARRRRKQGHPQRIKITTTPKKQAYAIEGGRKVIMHPDMAQELKREAGKDPELRATEAFLRKEKPQPNPDTPWRSPLRWSFTPILPGIISPGPTS
jgi:hypothetical protein